MNKILTYLFLLIPCLVFSQARLMLNNDPYIVMNGGVSAIPAYIVLANPATNAITQITAQVNGGIKTESEFNMVKWNIGTTTGTYIIPFTKATGGPIIPFTAQITSAGTGAGNIKFSTYSGAWDNNGYKPSDVTNMNSVWIGGNNSAKVIDRFWIVDANGYTAKPAATFAFTYVDVEWSLAGNNITEANLGAQRFDPTAGVGWNGYMPQGTVTAGSNTVTAVPVTAVNFARSWTLVDNKTPLPIELVRFEGKCSEKNVLINWETASETNNNYFTIERSADGITFQSIATVYGAGNSTSTLYYMFSDNSALANGGYYRLKQTDYNGDSKTSAVIFIASCTDNTNNIDVYSQGGDNYTLLINSAIADNYTITLYSELGQIMLAQKISVSEGYNRVLLPIENVAPAMYFVNVTNGKEKSFTKKIVVSHY